MSTEQAEGRARATKGLWEMPHQKTVNDWGGGAQSSSPANKQQTVLDTQSDQQQAVARQSVIRGGEVLVVGLGTCVLRNSKPAEPHACGAIRNETRSKEPATTTQTDDHDWAGETEGRSSEGSHHAEPQISSSSSTSSCMAICHGVIELSAMHPSRIRLMSWPAALLHPAQCGHVSW